MLKLRPIVVALSAGLLQACVAPPTVQEMSMQPVLRIRHSSDQTAATYYRLGKYYQERGNRELAVSAFTHSIALDNRQLEARNALAAILAQQGRLDEATSVLLQLVADYPEVAHPYNNLGYIYYMQGKYDDATTTLQRALALDSANERARNNLKMAQAAVATRGELATIALALAPAASETRSALSDATNTNRTQGDAVTPSSASPAPQQPMPESGKATAPSVTTAAPPGPALAIPPSLPQSRMDVVQVVPNVYELKLKSANAPVIAQRPTGQAPVAVAAPAPLDLKTAIGPIIAKRVTGQVPVAVAATTSVDQKAAPGPITTQRQAMQEPATVAAPALGVATPAKASRVEVANGNGVTGMAKRVGYVLGQQGIAVSRLTNARPFSQQDTKIQYRTGYEQAAVALKHAIRGHAVVVPTNNLSNRTDVRLVLGKDAIAHMAQIEGSAGESRLALNGESN